MSEPPQAPHPSRRRRLLAPAWLPRRRWARTLVYAVGALVVLAVLIQAVPYGRSHTNPPVTREPAWNSPETRAAVATSCFDCHSNQTNWRWYSNIAPVSWLVQSDVDGGRAALNFSEWDRPQEGAGDIVEQILGGDMPPSTYTLIHPGADLTRVQRERLARAMRATLAAGPPVSGG
jgi:hypothetical protein